MARGLKLRPGWGLDQRDPAQGYGRAPASLGRRHRARGRDRARDPAHALRARGRRGARDRRQGRRQVPQRPSRVRPVAGGSTAHLAALGRPSRRRALSTSISSASAAGCPGCATRTGSSRPWRDRGNGIATSPQRLSPSGRRPTAAAGGGTTRSATATSVLPPSCRWPYFLGLNGFESRGGRGGRRRGHGRPRQPGGSTNPGSPSGSAPEWCRAMRRHVSSLGFCRPQNPRRRPKHAGPDNASVQPFLASRCSRCYSHNMKRSAA